MLRFAEGNGFSLFSKKVKLSAGFYVLSKTNRSFFYLKEITNITID